MSAERWGETLLGALVLAVAAAFFFFAAAQAGGGAGAGGYELVARFDRANGVDVGAEVRISGVKVGVVSDIALENDRARLTLAMNREVAVRSESTATIASDGLLGGAYVAIEPAGPEPLPPGGEIVYTQGSIDLLTLFASFAQGRPEAEQGQPQ